MRRFQKKWLAPFSLFGLSRLGFAAACCIGGSSKSFISLQRLQKYEVGTSLSYKEDYGRFTPTGDVEPVETHRTVSVLIGAGVRFHQDWQMQMTVPLLSQAKSYGARSETAYGLGDTTLGVDWTVLEALFITDWYPTIRLQTGVKIPSGSVEEKTGGVWRPGTGNGLWEPYVGIGFEKSLGKFKLGIRTGYTTRMTATRDRLGDVFELSESLSFSPLPRLVLAVGTTQSWTGNSQVGGKTIAGSSGNAISVFMQPTFFIDRFWSVAVSAEFTVPQARWSHNSAASQSYSVTTRYGFF